MTSDDRLLELTQQSMQRTRLLSEASREHVVSVNNLNHLLAGTRTRVENSVQQAESALQSVRQRLERLESEMAGVLTDASNTLESVRLDQRTSHQQHQDAQAEVDSALLRLRAARQATLADLGRDLIRAQDSLRSTAKISETAALTVANRATQVQVQLAATRQALSEARDSLELQAKVVMADYLVMRDSLLAQLRALEHQFETTRLHTRASMDAMTEANESAQKEVDPVVCRRYEVELAEQMSLLSQQLGLAITDLRSVAVQPRQAADQDVLAMMQKLRDTFDPLERIAKVFHDAREAGLC